MAKLVFARQNLLDKLLLERAGISIHSNLCTALRSSFLEQFYSMAEMITDDHVVLLQVQARSRGRGRGVSSPPQEIFRLELNSATKVEFFYYNGQVSMEAKVSKYCRSY